MGAAESKEEKKEATASEVASTALAVGASVGLAAGAVYALLASGSEKEKKIMKDPVQDGKGKGNGNSDGDGDEMAKGPWMKAPGKNGETIRRNDFEENPKGYFNDLRKGKGKGNGNGNGNGDGDGDEMAKGPLMKAPGKNGETIRRNDFEENPKGYFSDLR